MGFAIACPLRLNHARGAMYSLQQYRAASLEARFNLRYATERLSEMLASNKGSSPLFRERQAYLSRCINEWRVVSETGYQVSYGYTDTESGKSVSCELPIK